MANYPDFSKIDFHQATAPTAADLQQWKDNLVKETGWGHEVTQHALLQLIVDNKVSCKNGNGRRVYFVKAKAE